MTDSSEHRALRESLGALVLGHLPPDEADQVRTHLAGCAQCGADMQELTPAASALAEARGPTPAPAVPGPGLGEWIEARIAGEEPRSASRGTLRT